MQFNGVLTYVTDVSLIRRSAVTYGFCRNRTCRGFSLFFKGVLKISLADLSSDFPDLVVRFSGHGGWDIEVGDMD